MILSPNVQRWYMMSEEITIQKRIVIRQKVDKKYKHWKEAENCKCAMCIEVERYASNFSNFSGVEIGLECLCGEKTTDIRKYLESL